MAGLLTRDLVCMSRSAVNGHWRQCLGRRVLSSGFVKERTSRNSISRLWYYTTFGGVAYLLGYTLHTSAQCRIQSSTDVPPLTLYQYATCPYCCKARAFLDYYQIPYTVVEVNPLFRREIRFSEYRKVPFVVGGGIQINDSSLLISVVRTCKLNLDLSLAQSLELYPEMVYTDAKGKSHSERANQYFVMLPESGESEMSLAERREEREWREWVDAKLVHTLPPNIYRTPYEALRSFDYISSVGNFNSFERIAAKYVGAVSMYLLSKMLKKRYKLKDDVRESLYDCCNEWTRALGGRKFLGGDVPNLADLAVYGVLSSVEKMSVFDDVLVHTRIGPWYRDIQRLVKDGHGQNK